MEQTASPSAVDLQPLDPRVRSLWLLTSLAAALGFAGAVALVDLNGALPTPRGIAGAVVLVAGAVGAVAWTNLRYQRWRYALRPHELWIRQGVVWVRVSVIPLSRLQFVDTRQGPLHRLFGLAEIVLHTAAVGTSGTVPGLDAAHAERLRERLAEVGRDVEPV